MRYFSFLMTGIVITISLLAAFQGDAAMPASGSAAYFASIQRSGTSIERLRSFIQQIPDNASFRHPARALRAVPPLDAVLKVYSGISGRTAVFPLPAQPYLPYAPIRGPDSILYV